MKPQTTGFLTDSLPDAAGNAYESAKTLQTSSQLSIFKVTEVFSLVAIKTGRAAVNAMLQISLSACFDMDFSKSPLEHLKVREDMVQRNEEKIIIENRFQKRTLQKPIGCLAILMVHYNADVIKLL